MMAIVEKMGLATHIYIYTYIIGHYNPSVRIIDLASHTTISRDLQFKLDSELQIF